MILEHSFEVGVPIEAAWETLTDLEVLAPCLPGAHLDSVGGEEHHGTFAVKLGAITAKFAGTARFVERDAFTHHAELHAEGRDQRGAGKARAAITADLSERGTSTRVRLVTDLRITGRVAQFGRGILPELSAKMIDQFATNLGARLEMGRDAPTAAAEVSAAAEFRASDVVSAVGPVRILKGLAAAAVVVWLIRWLRQRSDG